MKQQQQQQQHKQQQEQQQQKQKLQSNCTATKKNSVLGTSVAKVKKTTGTSSAISIATRPPGFSAANANTPPPGFSVEAPDKRSSDAQDLATISYGNVNGSSGCDSDKQFPPPIPQIPPNILSVLQSLNINHGTDGNGNNGGGDRYLRSHLSLVVLGHVDARKSTLTGRLLLSLNHVCRRHYQKHHTSSAQVGKPSFALAWFADKDDTKRERGLTIDVATKKIRTP